MLGNSTKTIGSRKRADTVLLATDTGINASNWFRTALPKRTAYRNTALCGTETEQGCLRNVTTEIAALLEEPQLARLYPYLARESEATVREVKDDLELPEESAYTSIGSSTPTSLRSPVMNSHDGTSLGKSS